MASALPTLYVGLVVAVLCVLGAFFAPRGNNRLILQVCIVMTLVCLYLAWAVIYLAQINPIIMPIQKPLH